MNSFCISSHFLKKAGCISGCVLSCVIAATGTFSTYPADAAQQGVPFGANVAQRHFCQILVLNPGVLAPSADFLELSSKQAGGSAGIAELTATNGSFWLSTDAPTGFTTMPTGGDTGVVFSSTYQTSGDTTTPETPGTTSTKLKRGVTQASVHMIANRSGSVFPAGNYSGEVTVRCE